MIIKPLNVLGLMGASSLNGFKAAVVKTDGIDIYETKNRRSFPCPDGLFQKIYSLVSTSDAPQNFIDDTQKEYLSFLLEIIDTYICETDEKIELIGLEGLAICTDLSDKQPYGFGQGKQIARETNISVVTNFHNADLLNGGLGGPILASYHNALAQDFGKPFVFIHIGAQTTLTWIGHYGEIVSFDCGPGNALIDAYMLKHAGISMDYNGKTAAMGTVNDKVVSQMMSTSYLAKYPPKIANRQTFSNKAEHLEGLSLIDGAATATAFAAEAVAYSIALYLPQIPRQTLICGDGAKNPTLVRFIRHRLKNMDIQTLLPQDINQEPDDAAAIGFLAARRLYNLPITFPTTTGVSMPLPGGEIFSKED